MSGALIRLNSKGSSRPRAPTRQVTWRHSGTPAWFFSAGVQCRPGEALERVETRGRQHPTDLILDAHERRGIISSERPLISRATRTEAILVSSICFCSCMSCNRPASSRLYAAIAPRPTDYLAIDEEANIALRAPELDRNLGPSSSESLCSRPCRGLETCGLVLIKKVPVSRKLEQARPSVLRVAGRRRRQIVERMVDGRAHRSRLLRHVRGIATAIAPSIESGPRSEEDDMVSAAVFQSFRESCVPRCLEDKEASSDAKHGSQASGRRIRGSNLSGLGRP